MGWTPDPLRGYLPPEPVRPHTHDQQRAPDRPWKDYDPELGDVTIGDGEIKGRFKQLDARTLTCRVHMILGSTSTIDGAIQIGIPEGWVPSGGEAPGSLSGGVDQASLALADDADGGTHLGAARFESIGPFDSGATIFTVRDANGVWNATNPITWASGDELIANFTIEVEPT